MVSMFLQHFGQFKQKQFVSPVIDNTGSPDLPNGLTDSDLASPLSSISPLNLRNTTVSPMLSSPLSKMGFSTLVGAGESLISRRRLTTKLGVLRTNPHGVELAKFPAYSAMNTPTGLTTVDISRPVKRKIVISDDLLNPMCGLNACSSPIPAKRHSNSFHRFNSEVT